MATASDWANLRERTVNYIAYAIDHERSPQWLKRQIYGDACELELSEGKAWNYAEGVADAFEAIRELAPVAR